ncbi:MAG: response regulator [Cyanobacteria bacterium SZAS LIN-2]|nr:response regulator [Cyanobacteria bacterium SZAS LIN-3]MBS1994739.1 response regulator [Cyanobacteria bacterium SZAS LIN-2]MBS2006945.1 response regulator [Cyanobacteria bacterium SZAS TMP-1]
MARILIVEDDENLRDMIREWLIFEKHTVQGCGTGLEALEQLAVLKFDVILLDWHLQDMYGVEVLKKFRAAGGTTPVLVLTGGSSNDDRQEAIAAGANNYVRKPFKLQELSVMLTNMVKEANSKEKR